MWRSLALACLIGLGLEAPAPAQTAFSTVPDRAIKSPDGHATVSIRSDADDNASVNLVVGGRSHVLRQVEKFGTVAALIDATWSPNSQIFSINVSDAGAVGGWHAMIYRLRSNDTPTFVDIERILAPHLRHFSHCDGGPEINYVAAAWPAGGHEVAILASVADHSLCQNMGDYKAFILDTRTWRIIKIIPQAHVPKSWTPAGYSIPKSGPAPRAVLASAF